MSEFVAACLLSEIPTGEAHAVSIAGMRLALVRVESEVYAIADACSHADVALSEGEVSGCTLECWLHGSQFDLRTGAPLTPPATKSVPVYPTRIVEGDGGQIVEVRTTPRDASELSAVPNQKEDQA